MTMTQDQSGTIDFLADPATHGLAAPVELIETHISVIVLAGPIAYKMKKAVKLPYVDFSSPEIREDACRNEVALNGETAPGLYIGLRRITRRPDGGLEFDGRGALVDTVIKMNRFEQEQLFDRLAGSGKLSAELMTAAARMIADYHGKAPVVSGSSGMENISRVLDINEAGFATSRVFDQAQVSRLADAFRSRLREHSRALDRRAQAGRVRRCHGDLHLRNICLLDDRPCLFDCIEFNPQIATIDVLYDLAFLLMDLWHRGLSDLANLAVNRYLDERDDEDGFCLLPFFMAIRAAVRAHVTATQAEEPDQDAVALAKEARSYFELASHLLEKVPTRLVAIGGLSGSGKTTVADRLASKIGSPPGARILESDRIRKALHGVQAETRLPASAYTAEISDAVYRQMALRAERILADGGCVVADAVFDDAGKRQQIEDAAGTSASSFQGIWLDADPALLLQRVRCRTGGPSDADAEVVAAQLARQHEGIAWRHIDASRPLEEIVAMLAKD